MFIGSDIMQTLGIDLIFSTKTVHWGDTYAPMRNMNLPVKPKNQTEEECHAQLQNNKTDANKLEHFQGSASRATKILVTCYKKVNLNEIVDNVEIISLKEKKLSF